MAQKGATGLIFFSWPTCASEQKAAFPPWGGGHFAKRSVYLFFGFLNRAASAWKLSKDPRSGPLSDPEYESQSDVEKERFGGKQVAKKKCALLLQPRLW